MNLLKKLALVLFVSAFVACSSDDDDNNFPNESEIPTSASDVDPDNSPEEEGIQEGSFSIVGRWVGTGYIEDGEMYPLEEGECAEHLTFDNKDIMSVNYSYNGEECVEDEIVFGAYTRDGGKLNVFIEGEKVSLTIEITETTLKLSGIDGEEVWTDVFEKMQ
ncbi:lipocalin family protein [Flavobacteriaceae bacterium XHP0103]|uniref:lipocalin family protein n=1 Tax=Marixanthotalea marina TaxID=2844359 RepID=UPI002989C897|nr:lipocalin family protein [Marixanthotalea marina]MBU3822179.1 lipocalin family protein [Marixanthotalea marina]